MRRAFIKDFPEYYVTDKGEVFSCKEKWRGKVKRIALKKNNRGYILVGLCKKGTITYRLVHRLVAEAFIPNPENKPCVNHKNGNPTDNCVDNLEWATYSENNTHSYRVLGKKPIMANLGRFGKEHWNSKIILQICDNKIIAEFYGTGEANRETGINAKNIYACCKGKVKTAGGYKWQFKGDKND